jgi:hypothetical protein
MANKPAATKRIQVNKAKTMLLGIVAGAAVITVFSLMASKTFLSESAYLNRVTSEKEKALKQLKDNIEAVSTLTESYKTFASASPNAIGGLPDGDGERDGDNARLVLDALPSKYDFPALTSSIEKLLAGYTINNITGSDDTILQDQAEATTEPIDIPFSINVSSDYNGMQLLVDTFERSIRPFEILTMDLTGSNTVLQANISAKTFYLPEKDLKTDTKVVK